MDKSFQETKVENVDGNCVIVTTLMSSDAGLRTPQNASCSFPTEAPPVLYLDNRWSAVPIPPAPQLLNSSTRSDETAPGAFCKTGRCCSCCRANAQENRLADPGRNGGNHWRNSGERDSLGTQVLVAMDANVLPSSSSSSWVMKRGAHLGPLVVVKQPRKASAAEWSGSLSEVEKMSYKREVDALHHQLEQTKGMLEEAEYKAEQRFLEKVKQFEESHREEERRRRQNFQDSLANLRAENEELARCVRHMEDNTARAAFQEREKLQNEWINRLSKNESQWRERFRVAQMQWEESVDEQMREKHESSRQVRELALTMKDLEMTLQQVTREKSLAEQERDALLSAQSLSRPKTASGEGEKIDSGVRTAHDAEVIPLRRALREAEKREAALMVQLEVCGNKTAAQEVKLENQLHQLRQELERERQRGSDLVKLCSSQVESLHEQLKDALRRNKQLTRELSRLQKMV